MRNFIIADHRLYPNYAASVTRHDARTLQMYHFSVGVPSPTVCLPFLAWVGGHWSGAPCLAHSACCVVHAAARAVNVPLTP